MAKYVKTDYVPESSKHYITAGKEYPITNGDERGGDFIDDEGRENFIFYESSMHLECRAWTVINR